MTRWVVLVTLLAGLLASLVVDGLLAPAPGGRTVGEPVLAGGDHLGPVVEVADGSVWSSPGAPDAVGIALVDTGTGPGSGSARTWSEVLRARPSRRRGDVVHGRAHDPRRPGEGRLGRSTGGEIGVTGFSGRDLAGLPDWRARIELSSAQAALAAREGVTSALLMVPSSPTVATFDRDAVRVAGAAARQGLHVGDRRAPGGRGGR